MIEEKTAEHAEDWKEFLFVDTPEEAIRKGIIASKGALVEEYASTVSAVSGVDARNRLVKLAKDSNFIVLNFEEDRYSQVSENSWRRYQSHGDLYLPAEK